MLEFLKAALPVPVYLEEPKSPPASYVIFERTSGGEYYGLRQSTIAFQSYGATMYKAAELNEKVKAAVARAIELNDIARVELNSDYNFTDTKTRRYRYQAVFDFNHY